MSAEGLWSGVRGAGDRAAELLRTPCLQSSVLVGVGCAGCMLAHKLHIRRESVVAPSTLTLTPTHAGSSSHAVLAACLTLATAATVHFGICFSEHSRKKELIREAFGRRNIKELPKSED